MAAYVVSALVLLMGTIILVRSFYLFRIREGEINITIREVDLDRVMNIRVSMVLEYATDFNIFDLEENKTAPCMTIEANIYFNI